MKIKPVGQAKPPQYPKKQEVSPKELNMLLPRRWQANVAVKITLGTLAAMTLTGCDSFYGATDGVPAPPPTPTPTTIVDDVLMGEPMAPTVWVAPLFVHGEGRGAYGCVMVAPPVFLSEAEALEIINEVAGEYGIAFAEDAPGLLNVQQPAVPLDDPDGRKSERIWMTFVPDFADSERGIVVEFVSAEDVQNWKQEQMSNLPDPHVEISAGSYDTRDAAAQLSEALEYADVPYGEFVAGVFYDPCGNADAEEPLESDEDREAHMQKTRALSLAQLEKQVRDFFGWLKTQGVI